MSGVLLCTWIVWLAPISLVAGVRILISLAAVWTIFTPVTRCLLERIFDRVFLLRRREYGAAG